MPTDPKHPRSVFAGLGGAISIILLAILQLAGAHPSPELSGAIATVCAYGTSLLPNGGSTS